MLILKALHLIAMVAWFAGLFYLPRLFVYHAQATDEISLQRFITMERRLYYAIMWPAAILTTACGFALFYPYQTYYLHTLWMPLKLCCVGVLWIYHLLCGYFTTQFARGSQCYTPLFYRIWNEIPTLLLVVIIGLVILKPR